MYNYNKKVLELFKNPKYAGELKDADAVGKLANLQCGDLMWVYIKVGKHRNGEEYIKDIKVKTFGCVAAIASAEALARLAKGKTLKEVKKIVKKNIADYLGGLPKEKLHCSVLGEEALKQAIEIYEAKKKKEKD